MRRFVTYLYEYDKGNRGKNCGFVRIDVREGEVEMEVHMRNCLRCGEKGTIYVLVEDEEQILGIEVGEIVVSNGRGERTLQLKENNIEESGYKFDEIIGIGIRCENGGYLASNWEDEDYEALTWGNFDVVYSQANSDDGKPMSIPSKQEVPIHLPMSSWTESSEQKFIEFETEQNVSKEPYSKIEKKVERMPLCSENEYKSESVSKKQNQYEHGIKTEETHIKSIPQVPWWRAQMESLLQTDMIPNSQMDDISHSKCKTAPQSDCLIQTPMEQMPSKICSYEKITVSDIRNLPSPNWYLCNNNFLLHGFFNYDYLIIKKEKTDNREKFYLGVPGIFEKQEKAMAMMFGFPYFESCSLEDLDRQEEFEQTEKTKEPKEGDFGCWYLVLNI